MSGPVPTPLEQILYQAVRRVAENVTGHLTDDDLAHGTSVHDDDMGLHDIHADDDHGYDDHGDDHGDGHHSEFVSFNAFNENSKILG